MIGGEKMFKLSNLPLKEISLTSAYGFRNISVKDKKYWWHNGIDFKASINTPVYAVAAGKVMAATNDDQGYGKYIAIDHGKWGSLYAHLADYVVTRAQTIKAGELIGYSGESGYVTAAHLHFEIRICRYENFWDRSKNDSNVFMRTVDPMLYIEEYIENSKELSIENASKLVKEKANLEDKTIDYIVEDYKYGYELISKLAKAMK